MTATQGVILIMVGVLIIYLVWAAKSPLNLPAPAPPSDGNGNGNGSTEPPPLPPNETT